MTSEHVEVLVEKAAEAAWPEFKSGMEPKEWRLAPQLRKDRLRIIVRAAIASLSAPKPCPCGDAGCKESFGPGCDLGKSEAHVAPAEAPPVAESPITARRPTCEFPHYLLPVPASCAVCEGEINPPPSAPVGVSRYVRDERGRMMRDGKPEPKISFGDGWNACLEALAQQPAAGPRSTHRVWRGDDWLPCYCAATSDHHIGSEQPAAVDEAAKDAEIEALRVRADAMAGEAIKHEARANRLAEALHKLEEACDDSDGAQYGTLGTTFVRDICKEALRDQGADRGRRAE